MWSSANYLRGVVGCRQWLLLLSKVALLLAVAQLPIDFELRQHDVEGSELGVLQRESASRSQLTTRREPSLARLHLAPTNPGVGSHARRFCAANLLLTKHHWPNGDRAPLLI